VSLGGFIAPPGHFTPYLLRGPGGGFSQKRVSLRALSLPTSPGGTGLQPSHLGGDPVLPKNKKLSATEEKGALGSTACFHRHNPAPRARRSRNLGILRRAQPGSEFSASGTVGALRHGVFTGSRLRALNKAIKHACMERCGETKVEIREESQKKPDILVQVRVPAFEANIANDQADPPLADQSREDLADDLAARGADDIADEEDLEGHERLGFQSPGRRSINSVGSMSTRILARKRTLLANLHQ
jgi:hypothetical protein